LHIGVSPSPADTDTFPFPENSRFVPSDKKQINYMVFNAVLMAKREKKLLRHF